MDAINQSIKKAKTALIILHVKENSTSTHVMCDEMLKKICKNKHDLFAFELRELPNLAVDVGSNSCAINKGGIFFVKEKKVLNVLSCADVFCLGIDGFEKEVYDLERKFEDDSKAELKIDPFLETVVEPFNMRNEALAGMFKDSGFRTKHEDDTDSDPWLKSVVDTPVPVSYKDKRVAEPQPESADAITQKLNRLANSLLPEETVCDALKRLKGSSKRMSVENCVIFNQITDDCTILSERGYQGIYQYSKESIQLKASHIMPITDGPNVPQGFFFDPVSGYYYNPTSGWYYDLDSGFYSIFGLWYTFNSETMTWHLID